MPQILKEDTRSAILLAARAVFAEKAFRDASMQDVARLAGVSAGNLYRYYPDKQSLYDAAFPPDLLDELSAALDRKIAGWQGVPLSAVTDPRGSEMRFRNELIDILAENRLYWIVLLRNGTGDALTARLVSFFERWHASVRPGSALDGRCRMMVTAVYRNLICLIASVLGDCEDPLDVRRALEDCIDYHMAGLSAMMEKWRNG
jgi:AcrR family transcriptional regulator